LSTHTLFFLFLLTILVFEIPDIYATTATAIVLKTGQTSISNDSISLDDNSVLDLSDSIVPVTFSARIRNIDIDLTQQVQFVSNVVGTPITIQNTELSEVIVSIPDQSKIVGPPNWNGELSPPKSIPTAGTVPSGFQTPTTSIQIGSPDFILVFDSPVTITLDNIVGQIAYKLPGKETWNLIDKCLGTYANPTNPTFPNECSISNEVDTKIITYHFTEFVGLEEIPKSSGGKGRTGVGPGGSGAGHIVPILPDDVASILSEEEETKVKLPDWFRIVILWWSEEKLTDEEVDNAMQYLFKILK